MEAELFSSSRKVELQDGISGRFIPSKGSQTGVFPTARYSSIVQGGFMEPRITAELTVLGLFTNCRLGLSANGMRMSFIASKTEATAIAPSAISFLTPSAISMELRARAVWVVAPSLR